MAGLTNPYEKPAAGGVERWNPALAKWEFQAIAQVRELEKSDVDDAPPTGSSVAVIEDRQLNPNDPQSGTVIQFLSTTGIPAGTSVSYAKAFMTAAVWASMDVIAASLSSSDWNVYGGIRGAAKKEALTDDQTQFLLNTRANVEMTAQAAKRALCLNAVGGGNGYAEIAWDMAGRFAGWWPLEFDRVTPTRNERRDLVYRCVQDYAGNTVDLDPADMIHIRGSSLIGTRGDDAIGRAIRSIASNIAVDEFAQSYYANGTNLGGFVTMKGKLDDEPFKEFKRRWNEKYSGPRKANSTAFLDGGATYTQLDSNAQKADMTNWKNTLIEEVARWFRVPPHKIGHLLRATNNNIEHQGLEFTRDTLRPWQTEIQQELDYKVFSPRGPRRFIELDLDWAAQGDYGGRATAYRTLINVGVFTINDVLRKLGENTIGPDGDKRLVQGAMVPLKDAGKLVEQKQAAGAEPPGRTGGTAEPKPPGGEPKAMLQAWLGTVYARVQRRQTNGRNNRRANPRADAEAHLEELLEEVAPFLGNDSVELAREAGRSALDGVSAQEAAARVIDHL